MAASCATRGTIQRASQAPPLQAAASRPEPTPWAVLLERHDKDEDGRISRTEYGRSDDAFRNLDRDHDGLITAADFKVPVEMPPQLAAPFILVRRFGGADADSIAIGDFDEAFETADENHDGAMDRSEFLGTDSPPGPDRFAPLLAVADADHDRRLTLQELKAYALRRDNDTDGRLSRRERMTPGVEPKTGWFEATERERAPDFTLAREEGEGPVTLSSFAGRKPVALIFGSFT